MFLFEAYNQPYTDVMRMPSSRRHRLVKIREEIVRIRDKGGRQAPPSYSTGVSATQAVQAPKQGA